MKTILIRLQFYFYFIPTPKKFIFLKENYFHFTTTPENSFFLKETIFIIRLPLKIYFSRVSQLWVYLGMFDTFYYGSESIESCIKSQRSFEMCDPHRNVIRCRYDNIISPNSTNSIIIGTNVRYVG